jgi:hypothetical protein
MTRSKTSLSRIERKLPPLNPKTYSIGSKAEDLVPTAQLQVITGVAEAPVPYPITIDEMKYPGKWPDEADGGTGIPRTPPRRANSDTPDTPDTPLNENQQLIARASTLLNDMKYAPLSRRERAARAAHEQAMRQCARLRDPLDW